MKDTLVSLKKFMWINQMRPCDDLSSWPLIRILLFRSKNQCIPHLCLQKLVILPLSCSVSKSYTNELRLFSSVFRCYFFNIEICGIGCHIFHLNCSSSYYFYLPRIFKNNYISWQKHSKKIDGDVHALYFIHPHPLPCFSSA